MASATNEQVTLLAPDISCAHCVATVQGALGQQPGVTRAQASAETKLVDVEFDPAVVTLAQITETLAEAGYPVKA
jgi:copper chaperone CopZ